MAVASLVSDWRPLPPTPTSRALPPGTRRMRQIRDRCSKTYLHGEKTKYLFRWFTNTSGQIQNRCSNTYLQREKTKYLLRWFTNSSGACTVERLILTYSTDQTLHKTTCTCSQLRGTLLCQSLCHMTSEDIKPPKQHSCRDADLMLTRFIASTLKLPSPSSLPPSLPPPPYSLRVNQFLCLQ